MDGTLSVEKVVELTRFPTPETDESLVAWARRVMPATVRRRADLSLRQEVADLRSAERAPCLRSFRSEDGACYGLEGWFPAEQGVVIERALQRFAERVPELPTDLVYDDGSPVPAETRAEARRADALYAICTGELSADPDPERSTVVVHVELESLRSAHGGCEIEGEPVVHSEVAARLCCDARLQVMLRGEGNRIVGVGWSARRPPRWLLRALRRRDEGCVFPGCCFKRFVHAHHIVRWPTGPTNLDNLVLVCPFHHKLVHEHAWTVEVDDDGAAVWLRPDGTRYDPSAPAREVPTRAPPRRSDNAA